MGNYEPKEGKINGVAVRLPTTLWPSHSSIRFRQAEAQSHVRRITDDDTTKYHYVVAALDQVIAGRLPNTLEDPQDDGKYEALNRHLLDMFCLSIQDWVDELLHMPVLGDKKTLLKCSFLRWLSYLLPF